MSLNISFNDLMTECRVNDPKEFRDLLKRNKFQIANDYDERVANKIAWRLGQQIDWFKYKSLQRSETEDSPLRSGLSPAVKLKIPTWYEKLGENIATREISHDHMIGLVCIGGFLEGRDEAEFIMRFTPGINVIIGDRGSGKSTALHLISVLAGSLSEGSNILIEKLLTLKEPAEVEQTEFERRLRKTLTTYGINILSSFFWRSGKVYCCTITREEDGWKYQLLLQNNDNWQPTDTSTALLNFPLQFLQQGEIVKISESGDNFYVNQVIDSLNDELYEGRSNLARKLKKLTEQYLRYEQNKIYYDFHKVEKFIDDRNEELYRLRTQIRYKETRFGALHPILEQWLAIWHRISKPRRFRNVLSLLKTDSDDDLFYFLFAPTIKFIQQANDRIYQVESRYRNVDLPNRYNTAIETPVNDESEFYETPNPNADPNNQIEIEPVKEMIQDADYRFGEATEELTEFAKLLIEFDGIHDSEGEEMDCAPPAGEISPRFEGSAIGGFGLLNRHLVFLRG
jgi:energy-coupling factor transporter ATP-binding protein EcfA2